jgi:hypothetical protein
MSVALNRRSAEGQTELYRHYDARDRLLYVGISLSAVGRLAQHRSDSGWYSDITRVTVERFATRQQALDAEALAIKSERPLHNIVHARGAPFLARTPASPEPQRNPEHPWSITRWMVGWTPHQSSVLYHDSEDSRNTAGTGILVRCPDYAQRTRGYDCTFGGCESRWRDMTSVQRSCAILSTANQMMVGYRLAPEVVHALLWPLIEYRRGLPYDMACPPGDLRFGKYAGWEEEQGD